MTPLMIAAAPALLLLGVAVASIINISQYQADRARLNVLRGLLGSFAVGAATYLVAQTVLLMRSNFQGFTSAAWLPLVIFSTAAASTVWHMRSIQRHSLVRN